MWSVRWKEGVERRWSVGMGVNVERSEVGRGT